MPHVLEEFGVNRFGLGDSRLLGQHLKFEEGCVQDAGCLVQPREQRLPFGVGAEVRVIVGRDEVLS